MSKHKPIPKNKRLMVYEKCNQRCAYCGCDLQLKDMQVDHIESVYLNSDVQKTMSDEEINDISNLMPSCRQCNFYKSTMPISDFRDKIITSLWENLKNNFNYKMLLKYGLIEENPHDIVFYFEQVLGLLN